MTALPLLEATSGGPAATALVGYALLVAGLVGGAAIMAYYFQRRDRVVKSSAAITKLREVNQRALPHIRAQGPLRHRFYHRVNSKSKYDRFDIDGFLRMTLLEHENWFNQEIESRLAATHEYERYQRAVDSEARMLLGTSAHPRVREVKFIKTERRLFEKRQLKYPTPKAAISLTLNYTSPKGQSSYTRDVTWQFHQLVDALQRARDERARQSTVQAMRARERQLMTPKMRVEILRRDNFRCQMCGASQQDGIVLHVDHIVPVSHGGRTVETNLQALCDACNVGKSNRFVG